MAVNQTERTQVVTKEFSPDQAGERVGLIDIHAGRWSDSCGSNYGTSIDIVLASIGENGAQGGYTERPDVGEGENIVFPGDVTGFVAATSLKLKIIEGHTLREHMLNPVFTLAADDNRTGSKGSHIVREATENDNAKWVETTPSIVTEIKDAMKRENIDEFYPFIYYVLNAAIGHAATRDKLEHLSKVNYEHLLADPQMNDMTVEQLRLSSEVNGRLQDVLKEDEKMKHVLTVFGGVPAAEVPEAFAGSRTKVHQLEQEAKDLAEELYIPYMTYLPVGEASGLRVRSWPYMDASVSVDDERAFGRELGALSDNNVVPANVELDREVKEVTGRIEFARSSVAMLTNLAQAEQKAV